MTKNSINGPFTRNVKKGEIICAAGEKQTDLFIIHSGKLLVFVTEKTKVSPLAYLNEGEYLGELSFFDHMPRSANVICIEDATLIQIPVTEISKQFPKWLYQVAINLTKNLREASGIIKKKGIRKKNVETLMPLTIDEQRDYFNALQKYIDENPELEKMA